jgi:hypothetical protein
VEGSAGQLRSVLSFTDWHGRQMIFRAAAASGDVANVIAITAIQAIGQE